MRMTVLASGSKGNSTVIASQRTRVLVDAGLSCRELLRRMHIAGEDPARLDAILVTHEHIDHVCGVAVLARRLGIPVFFTEPTHRAWVRMLTPRTTMTYAKWLDHLAAEKLARAEQTAKIPTYAVATTTQNGHPERSAAESKDLHFAGSATTPGAPPLAPERWEEPPQTSPEALESIASISAEAAALDPTLNRSDDPNTPLELPIEEECDPAPERTRQDPTYLPSVEYFRPGHHFTIGDLEIDPFTIPHDAADPCGFVFSSGGIRMAIATDLGYVPPNVKAALKRIDVLLLESNHDLEMLRDGPYPWSVKQRVLSRVGHLSNDATAEFLERDYDGGAHTIVLGHLSESNNAPELARITAERAIGNRMTLLGNRIVLAQQSIPLDPIQL